jgi:mannitol 2-dehydrogenase
MNEIIKLNQKNLPLLPGEVKVPAYDRSNIRTGIAHIGVGGFHRSHEAFYTDQVLNSGGTTDWGICGIALLDTESDRKIYQTLVSQDGLFTLLIINPDGTLNPGVIGSITEYLFAPDNPEAVIEKLASPEIKIITLTITEGGYNFNPATGEFQTENPSVQWDLNNPQNPKTVFGYLTQALKLRKERTIRAVTIQSCDNIQKNGDILKKMLLSFVRAAEPELTDWIEKNVSFPNSMVDRITPVTKQSDIERLRDIYRFDDAWPVVCEPFIQWITEDNYSQGRPDWESAGVQFVSNVGPYEKMKIRLLNAGHSLLGFLGSLYGCSTVDEAVNVPFLRTFLREFMDNEVTPLLGSVQGINLEDYKNSLIQRFGNPFIKDQLSRICSESSAKIPKFLLPTIREQLDRGGPVKRGTFIVAAWCRYLELTGTPGYDVEIQDKMRDILLDNAKASLNNDPLSFLNNEEIFDDLSHSGRFVGTYLQIIYSIRKYGIEMAIVKSDQM